MELLAPVGNIESFHAALEAGADAVYFGVPGINARNLSRDLKFEEIGAMIQFARGRGRKVYLAANSLILEKELDGLIEILTLVEKLTPDALIVQDLALIRLVQGNFPSLTLHASTLMGAHNYDNVDLLHRLGCERVVLARELTLAEIATLSKKTDIALEVFVHGAMCYSYSGLCLFSSYLGGKSGLRGRCVQPCRRGYRWPPKSGKFNRGKKRKSICAATGEPRYLFSMNDVEGFGAVKTLRDVGVESLKIEGRLRSANYVSKIVRAYRSVIDCDDSKYEEAVLFASQLAAEAMGRRTSSGYFFSQQPRGALTPHRSGNIGLYLGCFSSIRSFAGKLVGKITLRNSVEVGDRLRVHIKTNEERKSFNLKEMRLAGEKMSFSPAGRSVTLHLPLEATHFMGGKVELYKTDSGTEKSNDPGLTQEIALCRDKLLWVQQLKKTSMHKLQKKQKSEATLPRLGFAKRKKKLKRKKNGLPQNVQLEMWLKTDSPKLVLSHLPFSPDKFLLCLNKNMINQSSQIKKHLGKSSRKVVWALPPVVHDQDMAWLRKQIDVLVRSGFTAFQLAHIGQINLFAKRQVYLYGDYTLNIANSQALCAISQMGFQGSQVAIEMDRECVYHMLRGYKEYSQKKRPGSFANQIDVGMTVFGAPPLFTSRLAEPHLRQSRGVFSPKNEAFVFHATQSGMLTLPVRPFSLLPYLHDLQAIGLAYVIVDISYLNGVERDINEIHERLGNSGRYGKLPTFNYLGKLE